MKKTCFIVAGPNGAGKSTFAESFLPNEANCFYFVNADMIAKGISPLRPENFTKLYRDLADEWIVFDNSGDDPIVLDRSL